MRERDGNKLCRFAEKHGRLTKGPTAGEPLKLRHFQRGLLKALAASGARRGYVQMPKKNSKSTLGAVLALHGLCADGEEGSEVYGVAASKDQAKIVHGEARRMVELGPLHRHLKVYRDRIVHEASGSFYRVLASDAQHNDGLNPHLVIFDEVHALGSNRELWEIMSLGMGTREHPLMLGITTPGVRYGSDGQDSLAFTLYEYCQRLAAGEIVDPDFFYAIWEAPADCDLHDRQAWHKANPALRGKAPFLHVADMEAAARSTPENDFRIKRLGQWVASQSAWLPSGAWAGCEVASLPPSGARVVLGFDGSKSRDATALVGATCETFPQVFVVQVWERPLMSPHAWQVPRNEVTEAVAAACSRWDVPEVVMDPSLWVSEAQDWANDGIPVVEYPQTATRMVPATQRFYEAVTTSAMRHDGDPLLARHLGNAVIKPNGQIAKEHKDSGRKIDAAVAAVMAYDRACILGNVKPRRPVFVA